MSDILNQLGQCIDRANILEEFVNLVLFWHPKRSLNGKIALVQSKGIKFTNTCLIWVVRFYDIFFKCRYFFLFRTTDQNFFWRSFLLWRLRHMPPHVPLSSALLDMSWISHFQLLTIFYHMPYISMVFDWKFEFLI